jgi:DMSO/TMAO reductase YedYZ molybdopterin-dependent catalytic subunit
MINVKYVRDFHCVTGWSVRDVEWEGVRIRDIASIVGVRNDAKWVIFRSADGYESVVPAEDALSEDAIVALRMNGKPLDLK